MKTTLSLSLAAALVLSVLAEMGACAAESPAVKPAPTTVGQANDNMNSTELRRNAMSLELLGRGLLYS
ncbi:MAG: hypothetical protein ACXWP1_12435, partial [Bdellovibrionota bacterium]